MLKLCKNHSKSFKVPFGGGGSKKERENGVIFFFSFASAPSFPPLLSFLHSCLFLPASIIIRYHSIPFHSVSPHDHHHHYPLVHFLTPSPHFNPFLSLSYSLHFLLLLSIKLWQPTKTKRITTQGIGI